MTDLLIRLLVKSKDTSDPVVREKYGYLGSLVGITINLILFTMKLFVGLLVNSISVTADAFNNLSDTASSIITMLGFKLASAPADDDHPFGHGRIEYFSGLIVSVLVFYVGIQFLVSSIKKIINPEPLNFRWIPVILLLVSIGLKVWLSRFNHRIGTDINSTALKASALDARGDVMISSTVVSGLVIAKLFNLTIDGYVGVFVAAMILRSALSLIKDTVNPLLGDSSDAELIRNIEKIFLESDEIFGVHDTVVHNYGPNFSMGSTHVEVRDDISITEIHDIIDKAENRIAQLYNVEIAAHMDPIRVSDEKTRTLIKNIVSEIKKIDEVKSLHDIRVRYDEGEGILLGDIVADTSLVKTPEDEKKLMDRVCEIAKNSFGLNASVVIDRENTVVRRNGILRS